MYSFIQDIATWVDKVKTIFKIYEYVDSQLKFNLTALIVNGNFKLTNITWKKKKF